MWDVSEGGMKSCGVEDSGEKSMAILGDSWWSQTCGISFLNGFRVLHGRRVMSA